ncbi:ComEC/Rec2 family competence protein [Paenibacillus albicereus]|uniref:ComEC/Rec2 family competence protein n=1 Tax=Paenibacillus albicereus TaxID=2726185 RepID=A0A6H2GZ66_9BACL|nr:ComEC/Rec2 family competence protein [Paenibacillus albicereus]QJC52639.1 ComEC/Rec2 family competence protein [Paenibacillus albicereus]
MIDPMQGRGWPIEPPRRKRGWLDGRPLVWAAVCFVAGSSAAAYATPGGMLAAGLGLGLVLAALALAGQARPGLAAACLAAYALAAGERQWAEARSVTALAAEYAAAAAQLEPPELRAEAAGTIASPVRLDGDVAQLRVEAHRLRAGDAQQAMPLRETLLVRVKLLHEQELAAARSWRRGDRVRLRGTLEVPAPPANRGGFDYRRYLRSQGIAWQLQVQGAGAVEAAPGSPWSAAALLGRMDAARASLGGALTRLYPAEQAGYMQALVLGGQDETDPELYRRFARLGLTHIMAVSGMHVAVMLGLLAGLLRLLRLSRERILVLLLLAVPPYVLLTGASPSILRAGLMALLGLAAARAGKLKDGLHLLAASAVLLLLWEPRLIESVSFQLSYIVTAGLILGVPAVQRVRPRPRGRSRFLYDAVVVTIVAQAASFPVTIFYFNQLHLLSLPANLLLVPFISFLIMPAGAAAMLLEPLWPWAAQAIASVSAVGNEWTFRLIERMGSWRQGATVWATPPLWWIGAYYGAAFGLLASLARWKSLRQNEAAAAAEAGDEDTQPLGVVAAAAAGSGPASVRARVPSGLHASGPASIRTLVLRLMRALAGAAFARTRGMPRLRARSAAVASGASLLALLLHAAHPDWSGRPATVSFLSVGQGDSTLIRTASGKTILIDGGGTIPFQKEAWRERRDPYEIGRKLLVPLLMKRGVDRIDLLVATHLDQDHIGGLEAVVDSLPVRRLLWNGSLDAEGEPPPFLREAIELGIPLYGAQGGQSWQLDGETRLDVLWPDQQESLQPLEEQNERSVVLLLTLSGRTFLLTGDVGSVSEPSMLALARSLGLSGPIDVLKAGHHGSKHSTSPAWLAAWRPSMAVLSAGLGNRYGHPADEVLERLERAGSRALRTDHNGEIEFRIHRDGEMEMRLLREEGKAME